MGQKFARYDSSGNINGYFDSVESPVPAGVTNVIEITDEQWQASINNPGYFVKGGALVVPITPTAVQLLAAAQATQTAIISAACAFAIVSGFTSSALGEAYTYPSQATDQQNLASSVLAAIVATQNATPWAPDTQYAAGANMSLAGQILTCISAGPSGATAPALPTAAGQIVNDGTAQWELWTTPFWCENPAGNWAFVPHTAPQIQKVGIDGKAQVLSYMAQNKSLQEQISAAETVPAVEAIAWP